MRAWRDDVIPRVFHFLLLLDTTTQLHSSSANSLSATCTNEHVSNNNEQILTLLHQTRVSSVRTMNWHESPPGGYHTRGDEPSTPRTPCPLLTITTRVHYCLGSETRKPSAIEPLPYLCRPPTLRTAQPSANRVAMGDYCAINSPSTSPLFWTSYFQSRSELARSIVTEILQLGLQNVCTITNVTRQE